MPLGRSAAAIGLSTAAKPSATTRVVRRAIGRCLTRTW